MKYLCNKKAVYMRQTKRRFQKAWKKLFVHHIGKIRFWQTLGGAFFLSELIFFLLSIWLRICGGGVKVFSIYWQFVFVRWRTNFQRDHVEGGSNIVVKTVGNFYRQAFFYAKRCCNVTKIFLIFTLQQYTISINYVRILNVNILGFFRNYKR